MVRQHTAAEMVDFDEMRTLRYIFWISDWIAEAHYEEMVQTARGINDEFGFNTTLAATFLDEIEEDGDQAFLHEHEYHRY
ncbi:hypothetical protein [Halosimplex halobium]|uniref:hypothetical protein n=1 Tax=Halosimplex halobium TaxID=3396618 RepID=UPI003F573746